MSMTDWKITGQTFANCNRDWGCPCQFNALPTHGDCHALSAYRVVKGHFGDVSLDGVVFAWLIKWPGAVHEGHGTQQLIVDTNATEEQRAAVEAIVHGRESAEGANFFQVFNTTITTTLETLSLPIEFECNVEERTAKVVIADLAEATGEPIRNPMTGDPHRAQVTLPHGMEYHTAEYGSGTTKATGGVALDFAGTHAHFFEIDMSGTGVVHP